MCSHGKSSTEECSSPGDDDDDDRDSSFDYNDDTDQEYEDFEESEEEEVIYISDEEEEEEELKIETHAEGYETVTDGGGNLTGADMDRSPSSVVPVLTISDQSHRASDLLLLVSLNNVRLAEETAAAMEELVRKADEELDHHQAPNGHVQKELEDLMRLVEVRQFDGLDVLAAQGSSSSTEEASDPRFHGESTREVAVVDMTPLSIVQLLMDTGLWASAFCDIVAGATAFGVVLQREGSCDGLIQVMSAEFHLKTPLVSNRKTYYFARLSKLLPCGRWGVVDVSLENVLPISEVISFRRKASGCVIQQLPHGPSRVTWVEQGEAGDSNYRFVDHNLFRHIVRSGSAFGAKRWLASMLRHTHWLQTLSGPTHGEVNVPENGREGLLNLSDRMRRNYFQVFCGSSDRVWSPLPVPGSEDVLLIRHSNSLSTSARVSDVRTTVAFTTSVWLPSHPDVVFNFLRHESSRQQWDVLLMGGRSIREVAHVTIGDKTENRVSILEVECSRNKKEIMYLQESYRDEMGSSSYVVFAPIDILPMSILLSGSASPDYLTILPSGFTILPHKPASLVAGETGSILTVGFHIADCCEGDYMSEENVQVIDDIIKTTIANIKLALTTSL